MCSAAVGTIYISAVEVGYERSLVWCFVECGQRYFRTVCFFTHISIFHFKSICAMYSAMNRSCVHQHWTRLLFLHNSRLSSGRFPMASSPRGLASPPPPSALSMGIKRQSDSINDNNKTAVPSSSVGSSSGGGRRDPLDLSFDNAEAAFRSKTTLQVLRAYLVFTLCSSNYLVENNMKVSSHFQDFLFFVSYHSFCFHHLHNLTVNENR